LAWWGRVTSRVGCDPAGLQGGHYADDRQHPDVNRAPCAGRDVDVDVESGSVGELILRGETIMKGYWNKPAETDETLRDGWLHTGDLARVDGDGYLTLVDRLKDLIITAGFNVYSVEVERALAAHPDIVDVAVVGRAHPDYGESIVAVITVREGATVTLDDVKAFCSDKIARYKIPHDLVVATIPRNQSGKVLKHQLRDRVGAALAATT
jgi:fatty-acyl-CoA synthase/feruloyl-CoA synthase